MSAGRHACPRSIPRPPPFSPPPGPPRRSLGRRLCPLSLVLGEILSVHPSLLLFFFFFSPVSFSPNYPAEFLFCLFGFLFITDNTLVFLSPLFFLLPNDIQKAGFFIFFPFNGSLRIEGSFFPFLFPPRSKVGRPFFFHISWDPPQNKEKKPILSPSPPWAEGGGPFFPLCQGIVCEAGGLPVSFFSFFFLRATLLFSPSLCITRNHPISPFSPLANFTNFLSRPPVLFPSDAFFVFFSC